ncbi:MAG TPA: PAS domain-containing protein, partial [Rhodocyclaceae bacterium]
MIAALIRSIRYTRRGAVAASALVALAFSTVPAYFAADYRQSIQQQLAAEAERHLQNRIALAQEMLDQAKAVPGIIAPTLSSSARPEQTEAAVRNLLKMGRIVESIRVAPDNGPSTTIYRTEAAQRSPLNAFALPRSAMLSVRQPHAAIGDGTLIISQPLAELDAQGKPHHWGSLVADASIGYLIQELQLLPLVREGFGISFRVQWQSGAPDTVLYTGGNIEEVRFSRSTPLVGGELLTLTIAPPAPATTGLSILSQLGILLSGGLLFAFTYYLLRRPQELERQVAARTRQIDDEKTSLRREIDARIKAEEYLERSHTLLDSIFEHIPGMIVLKRASDLRVARINRSAEKTLGRSRDFLIGRSSEEIFSPETADFFTQTDRQVLQQGGLLELPIHRVDMPAETQRWIRYRKSILRDRNGQPQYILEFGEDVTEREILDRQFKEQLYFLKQLIDAFPGPVFSKDLDGRYQTVNLQFEKFLGLSREQLIGKTVHDVLPKEIADEYEIGDQILLKSGGSRSSEASVRRRDGRVAEIMLYKAAILTQDGNTSGVVGIALDISERKAAERDVVRLNRVLTILSEINKLIIYTRNRQQLLEDARRIIQDV